MPRYCANADFAQRATTRQKRYVKTAATGQPASNQLVPMLPPSVPGKTCRSALTTQMGLTRFCRQLSYAI